MIFFKERWLRRGGRFCEVWLAAHDVRAQPADREHLVDVSADLAQLLAPPPHRPRASLRLASALVLGTARRARELADELLHSCSLVLERLDKRNKFETITDETRENPSSEQTSRVESKTYDTSAENLEEQSKRDTEHSDRDITNEQNSIGDESHRSEDRHNFDESVDSNNGGEFHTSADEFDRTFIVKSPKFVFLEDIERVSSVLLPAQSHEQNQTESPTSPIIGSSVRVNKRKRKAFCRSPVIRYRYRNKNDESPIIGRKYQVRRSMIQQYENTEMQASTEQSSTQKDPLTPNVQSTEMNTINSDEPRLSTVDRMQTDATEHGDTTEMHTIQTETAGSPGMQTLLTNTEDSFDLSTIQTNMEFSPENNGMINREAGVSDSIQTGPNEIRNTTATDIRDSSDQNAMQTCPLASTVADATFMEVDTPSKSETRLEGRSVSLPKRARGVSTAPSTRRRRRRRPRVAWYHTKARATRSSPPLTRSRNHGTDESTSKISPSPSRENHRAIASTHPVEHSSPGVEDSIPISPRNMDDLSSICGDDDRFTEHNSSSPRRNFADQIQTSCETPLHLEDQVMRRAPDSNFNITFRSTMSRESISKYPSASTPQPKKTLSTMSTPSNNFESVTEVVRVEIHEPPHHAMHAQRNINIRRMAISPARASSLVSHLASDEELEMVSCSNKEVHVSQNMADIDYMEADSSLQLSSKYSENEMSFEKSNLDINENQELEEHENITPKHINSNLFDEESATDDSIEDIPRYVRQKLSTISEERATLSNSGDNPEAEFLGTEGDGINVEKGTKHSEEEIQAENCGNTSHKGGSARQSKNSPQNYQDASIIDGLNISTDLDSRIGDQTASDGSFSSKTSEDFDCKMDIFPKGKHFESKRMIQVFCSLSKFPRLDKQVKEFWKEKEGRQ